MAVHVSTAPRDHTPADAPASRPVRPRTLALLRASTATVALAGDFNTGKSSLAARLTGASIPTSYLPETGAPAYIACGPQTRAQVILPSRARREIAPDAASIAAATSLYDADGRRRDAAELPIRLDLVLPGGGLPRDVHLVDLPGMNDACALEAIARREAADVDLLVYVLNSRQCFTLHEQDALRQIVKQRGPHGIALVLNVIDADTPAAWQHFQSRSGPALCERIRVVLPEVGLDPAQVPLFLLSARAAEPDGEDYGLEAFRRWIAENAPPASPAVARSRRARAERACAAVDARLERLEARAKAARDTARQAQAAHAGLLASRESLRRAVPRLLADALCSFEEGAADTCQRINALIESEELQRDDSYENVLNHGLRAASRAERLINGLDVELRQRGFPVLKRRTRDLIETALRAPCQTVTVADTPMRLIRTGLWGVIATIVIGPAGAVAVSTLSLAAARADKLRCDRELTSQAVRDAMACGVYEVREQCGGMLEELLACVLGDMPEPPPSPEPAERRLAILAQRRSRVKALLGVA